MGQCGLVEVVAAEDPTQRMELKPGYFAEVRGREMHGGLAHLESVTAWKNNYFYFHDQHISTILRQISRWYDVDFAYDDNLDISDMYFSGSVSSTKNLSQVLRIMERTGMVKFTIKGRRVLVMD